MQIGAALGFSVLLKGIGGICRAAKKENDMKRWISLLLALALALTMGTSALAYSEHDPYAVAEGLQALGLLRGGSDGFELGRQPTRAEAVVLLLRLLGRRDDELAAYGGRCPFRDVPDWAKGAIGYAYVSGIAAGTGGGRFDADKPATKQMFAAFLLRALGYADDTHGDADFAYADAVAFAAKKGLLDATSRAFDRGVCVKMMETALEAPTKGGAPLWQELAQRGVFTQTQYREAMRLAAATPAWKAVAPGASSYQSLYPDFYAPQPYAAERVAEHTVYLTFDDGPSARTDEVLATLAEKNVKATFFVVGHTDEADFERMRQIVAQGHTIGMHSYSHDYQKIYASVEAFLADFYRNFNQIRSVTGVTPTAFRFPGGSVNGYNKAVRKAIVAEMERRGFVPYDWNVTSGDAAAGGARTDQVFGNIVNQSIGKPRCIVLCHDSAPKRTTASALGSVIDELRTMGFGFAPITPTVRPYLF